MPVFPRGSRFGGASGDRYIVTRKLGEGQFAEVYEVRDTLEKDVRRAVKIEKKRDMRSVKQESKILKKLVELQCPLVVEPYDHGSSEDRFYLIMELLGPNLAEARKDLFAASGVKGGSGGLPPSVVRPIGLCMLSALEGMHMAGFLHRDVKPANFAVFPPSIGILQGSWKIIDFGLARRFTDDAGAALPPRADAAFRGSTAYASVHAHQEMDLGRRDDLWSWLYCLVELMEGSLPWRADAAAVMQQRILVEAAEAASGPGGGAGGYGQATGSEQRERVRAMKQMCIEQPSLLTQNPFWQEAVTDISKHLASLEFGAVPDYSFLRSCFLSVADQPPQGINGYELPSATSAWGVGQAYALEYRDTPLSPGEEAGQGYTALEPHYSVTAVEGGAPPSSLHYPHAAEHAHHGMLPPQPSSATAAAAAQMMVSGGGGLIGGTVGNGLRDGGGGGHKTRISREEKRLEGAVSEAWRSARYSSSQDEEVAAESRAAESMGAVASAVKQGLVSKEAKELHAKLAALHPVEALSVMAAVIRDATEEVDPGSGNVLSHVLSELALFTRHEAKRCDVKFIKHHHQEPPPPAAS